MRLYKLNDLDLLYLYKLPHFSLQKAIKEAPYLRDAYVELAMLEYDKKNYLEVDKYCKEADTESAKKEKELIEL